VQGFLPPGKLCPSKSIKQPTGFHRRWWYTFVCVELLRKIFHQELTSSTFTMTITHEITAKVREGDWKRQQNQPLLFFLLQLIYKNEWKVVVSDLSLFINFLCETGQCRLGVAQWLACLSASRKRSRILTPTRYLRAGGPFAEPKAKRKNGEGLRTIVCSKWGVTNQCSRTPLKINKKVICSSWIRRLPLLLLHLALEPSVNEKSRHRLNGDLERTVINFIYRYNLFCTYI